MSATGSARTKFSTGMDLLSMMVEPRRRAVNGLKQQINYGRRPATTELRLDRARVCVVLGGGFLSPLLLASIFGFHCGERAQPGGEIARETITAKRRPRVAFAHATTWMREKSQQWPLGRG